MSGYAAAMSSAEVLAELAAEDPDVVLVTQDFGAIGSFTQRFAARHFDVGISEQNLIGVAAGLAHAGKLAFVLGMAPFVSMRSFEQIRDDCAYNRKRVKILAPFAGLEAGPWGATHHAMEDIALLRTIPGMTIVSPADRREAARAVRAVAATDGPAYVRLGTLGRLDGYEAEFRIGGSAVLRQGGDVAILATGGCVASAVAAAEALAGGGIAARVVNVYSLKPLDREMVERAAREIGRVVTVEEHSILGGLGGAVAEILAEIGTGRLHRVGVRDVFCTDIEPYRDMLRRHGIDAAGIEKAAREVVAAA